MNTTRVMPAIAFSIGILLLEGGGSVLHALVLQDVPAELVEKGVDLWWMLSRDLLLASLGGAIFLVASWWWSGQSHAQSALFLGIVFALVLEGINWALPNSLLAPGSVIHGLAAWGYFVGGVFLAAWISTRKGA